MICLAACGVVYLTAEINRRVLGRMKHRFLACHGGVVENLAVATMDRTQNLRRSREPNNSTEIKVETTHTDDLPEGPLAFDENPREREIGPR